MIGWGTRLALIASCGSVAAAWDSGGGGGMDVDGMDSICLTPSEDTGGGGVVVVVGGGEGTVGSFLDESLFETIGWFTGSGGRDSGGTDETIVIVVDNDTTADSASF